MGGFACSRCWDYNCGCTPEELEKFKVETKIWLKNNPPKPFEKSLTNPAVEFGDIVVKSEKQYIVKEVVQGVAYVCEFTDDPTEDYRTKVLEEPYDVMRLAYDS